MGGAFGTAALSLILLDLGAGFGLSAVSPWSTAGASAATVGTVGLVWMVIAEAIASATGGYLTGRLRTGWHPLHGDEAHFRDTANGFLAWAVALVVTVTFLASAASSVVGRTRGEQGAAGTETAYFADRLLRGGNASGADADSALRVEAGRIMERALSGGDRSGANDAWLAQLVAAKTGLSPSDAEKRVTETMAEARAAVDEARRITARLLLWTFLALLIGAFCASYAATVGGRQRDRVQVV